MTEYAIAEQGGHAMAILGRAFALESGLGMPKDPNAARELYRHAASRGIGVAAGAIAKSILANSTEEADRAEAVTWFRQAASNGDPTAHHALAEMAERRTPQTSDDLEEALFHYAVEERIFSAIGRAADADEPGFTRARIARRLPPDRVAKVWQRVRDWHPGS